MKREELKELIDVLERERYNDSYIGIFYAFEGEATYLKGNREGFIELGKRMLEAAYNFGEIISTKNSDSKANFDKGPWFDENSEVSLELIEGTHDKRQNLLEIPSKLKLSLKDKIKNIFGFTVLIVVLLSIPVGGYKMITWIIQILFG